MEILLEFLKRGILLVLMLSLSTTLVAAGVGLVVGILQAVTQVQEQTISAAPKIVAVFLVLLLGGGFMIELMTNFFRDAAFIAFNQLPQDGIFVLKPSSSQSDGYSRARAFFEAQVNSADGNSDKLNALMKGWSGQSQVDSASKSTRVFKPGQTPANPASHAEQLILDKSSAENSARP
ncbi:MAG: flagellar biosynthetic protein FliQ [Cyanobacteria bacterium P01_H01_bin.74]